MGQTMEQDLISKKELLELTGISYGQLYRWKRERLLPEDWFIKRSSFTGQKTFFPRQQALERINKIKELKDSHSLSKIAEVLSPTAGGAIPLTRIKEIIGGNANYLNAVVARLRDTDEVMRNLPLELQFLTFSEAVLIGALGALIENEVLDTSQALELSLEGRELSQQWAKENMGCEVLVVSEENAGLHARQSWHLALFKLDAPPHFSKRIRVVAQLPLETISANIKRSLQELANSEEVVS